MHIKVGVGESGCGGEEVVAGGGRGADAEGSGVRVQGVH